MHSKITGRFSSPSLVAILILLIFILLQTRQNFTETRNKTQSLKQKMLEMRQQKQEEPPGTQTSKNCNKEGYLFLMEKSKLMFLFAPFS